VSQSYKDSLRVYIENVKFGIVQNVYGPSGGAPLKCHSFWQENGNGYTGASEDCDGNVPWHLNDVTILENIDVQIKNLDVYFHDD
jgi:hypothetical protein